MSDDPILAALTRIEEELSRHGTELSRQSAEQDRLREQINGKLDTILDQMSALRQDTDTVRGHVIYGLQENLTLSQRITKLEEEMRRR